MSYLLTNKTISGLQMRSALLDGWAERFNTLTEHRDNQLRRHICNDPSSLQGSNISMVNHPLAMLLFQPRYTTMRKFQRLWHSEGDRHSGAVKKMIGNIRDSDYCGRSAKEADDEGTSRQSAMFKKKVKTYACKIHKGMSSVVPKYKVIIRVIDDTGSCCLFAIMRIRINAVDESPLKFGYQDMIPFNIEQTPESVKGVQSAVGASSSKEQSIGISSINEKEKRVVIDLENYAEDESDAKKAKKSMVQVKVEKEDE
ncbi:hypothetical protein Tco_0020043 [Tanacetum coccineum]